MSSPTKKQSNVLQVQRLELQASDPTSLRCSGQGICLEVRALAEDLWRLRIARSATFSTEPSWAVTKTSWPLVPVKVKSSRHQVALQTSQGQFILNLKDGAWHVQDRFGLTLFAAAAGRTGFANSAPYIALSLDADEAIFGLGESSGTFNKRGLIREFWNIDVGGHARTVHASLRNMYISIPFALSLRHGRAAGLFWDNPARQTWDMGQTEFDLWKLSAASGEVDLYLFLGPACAGILERYTELTGRMPLPPEWALGYQQCRYSYESRRRVEEVARSFRQKKIPCDVIYLDIHYMDDYRVFTFGKNFPRPKQMIADLARQGFKTVTIVDPGVKDDPHFPVLQRGTERRAFVKAADGHSDYRGKVWPGLVRFPDFLNGRTRQWWGEEQARFQRLGVAGFWNDMNEPADFSQPDKDFPRECRHSTDHGPRRHAEVHNVYGSQMARASYEGARAAAPEVRPFIITRAGYAGLQRYAAVWTGDNDSSWEHLADSVQMLLNLSVSGVPFCGADTGGFHHNTTGELLARWTQLAAFTPFFRNHSNIGTIDQEPWAFGPRIEGICRRFIELRYQLLPYFYSLFVEAHRRGTPIMRPLFWHYENDPIAAAASDQFLLGPDLLIAPMLRQGATVRSVYLPAGIWFDFWTGAAFRGGQHILAEASLERIPLFTRTGALLPTIPLQQYIGEKSTDVITLHLWPGRHGELLWYEDDGRSLAHEAGQFHERQLTFNRRKATNRLSFSAAAGALPSRIKLWRIVLHHALRAVRPKVQGKGVKAQFQPAFGCCSFEVPNRLEAFEIQWT